jgi:uncharacterized membrane protein
LYVRIKYFFNNGVIDIILIPEEFRGAYSTLGEHCLDLWASQIKRVPIFLDVYEYLDTIVTGLNQEKK